MFSLLVFTIRAVACVFAVLCVLILSVWIWWTERDMQNEQTESIELRSHRADVLNVHNGVEF
jgi:hypothetical protein